MQCGIVGVQTVTGPAPMCAANQTTLDSGNCKATTGTFITVAAGASCAAGSEQDGAAHADGSIKCFPAVPPTTCTATFTYNSGNQSCTKVGQVMTPVSPDVSITYECPAGSTHVSGSGATRQCAATTTSPVPIASYKCAGKTATVIIGAGQSPTAGDDVIVGTPGPDDIDGLGGKDIICGWDGDDILAGGDGVDRIFGGDGNDTISGDANSDRLFGNAGDDTIIGGSGADRIWAGSGDDIVFGGGGQDTIRGGSGNDTIQGNHQSDKIYGDGGNDILRGAKGKDRIWGGDGDDELYGGDNTDFLHGGPGTDHANGQAGNDNPLVSNVSGCIAETRVSC